MGPLGNEAGSNRVMMPPARLDAAFINLVCGDGISLGIKLAPLCAALPSMDLVFLDAIRIQFHGS